MKEKENERKGNDNDTMKETNKEVKERINK